MTHREGRTLVLRREKPQQCDYCGQIRELRPYGKNGATICFKCATKPENIGTAIEVFGKILDGVDDLVV